MGYRSPIATVALIGHTGRMFFTRFKEHTNLRNKEADDEGKSQLFTNHPLNTGHECEISNLSVLHIEQAGYKLDTLEILKIAKPTMNFFEIRNRI